MPDVLLPESDSAPDPEASAKPESQESDDSTYDSSFAEAFAQDGAEQPETADAVEHDDTGDSQTTSDKAEKAEPGKQDLAITASELQTLQAAGLSEALYSNWSREQIEGFVSKAREQQSQAAELKAQLDKLKPAEPPKKAEPPPDIAKVIDETMKKLAESYEDEIQPLGDALTAIGSMYSSLAEQHQQAQQQLQLVSPMMELMSDLVLHNALGGLKDDYPSISKPESRDAVAKRFWLEWNTGAYSDPNKSIIEQIQEAARNAAKVTFLNTTEQTAAATLATKNRSRVQSQPRVGPTQQRAKPKTEDDIYDDAYKQFMTDSAA